MHNVSENLDELAENFEKTKQYFSGLKQCNHICIKKKPLRGIFCKNTAKKDKTIRYVVQKSLGKKFLHLKFLIGLGKFIKYTYFKSLSKY